MNEETIFAAALEIEQPDQRRAFLERACAGDAEMRSRVEELLKADSAAGSFLEHPPAGVDATVLTTRAARDTADGDWAGRHQFLEPCDKPDRIGKLDQYEIIEVVGQGGMGAVLRGFDTKLSRIVAVKVMAPHLAANPTAVRRFLREAAAAAAVHHDHVVTIHAVDESHQPPYLVMQFIEGQTLQQKIDREGALQLAQILRIGSQAATGLAAAHKSGLIHRDVKPANILLENGVERVKITDFGLARAADDLQVTQTGIIAGTPQYMSPEQARGEPIDARSDLFSLGSVLYTMCTGRPAFRADNPVAVLRRVCDDQPRPIREVNPSIPEWLEAIVLKLLAKDPAERFQSAAELAELLGQHLAHVQNPATAPFPAPIARKEGVKATRTTALAAQDRFPPPPFWIWGPGLLLAALAMLISVLKVVFSFDPRPIAPAFVVLMFAFMTALVVWAFVTQWKRTWAPGMATTDAQPRQWTGRGLFIQHPVAGAVAILMLMVALSVATYLLTAAWHRRLAAKHTARAVAEAHSSVTWKPTDNADMATIVKEAEADRQAKRYDLALAKFAWCYEESLLLGPGPTNPAALEALVGWKTLAEVYPPALDQLHETRDAAAANVKRGAQVPQSFAGLAMINELLGDEKSTSELFRWLDANRPEEAKAAFAAMPLSLSSVLSALVNAKEYRLAAKYLNPQKDYDQIVIGFRSIKDVANVTKNQTILTVWKDLCANKVATVVALLVVNDRRAEAEGIVAQARQEWDNATFHAALNSALEGKVPQQRLYFDMVLPMQKPQGKGDDTR